MPEPSQKHTGGILLARKVLALAIDFFFPFLNKGNRIMGVYIIKHGRLDDTSALPPK